MRTLRAATFALVFLGAAPAFAGTSSAPAAAAKSADMNPSSETLARAREKIAEGLKALDDKTLDVALKAFNEAFAAGDGDGAFYLGRMVELGVGLKADFDKARILYLAAADKGSAKAMNRLGLMHYRGEKVLQDYAAAFELICKAADLGDADAEFNCAGLHADGKGTPKDLTQAIAWYQKAADQDHIGAIVALAFAYRDGLGVAPDIGKAEGYFEKAAVKGNPVSLYELGAMYEAGKPMSRDLAKAHLYYNLAAARRHPAAQTALERVTAMMQPADVASAQAVAKAWKATP
jgi:TPR repeat protein